MEGYEVKIRKISKEISPKERIKIKDFSNANSIDELTQEEPIVVTPDYYAVIDVHNEKSDNKDYVKTVVVDKSGNKFITGSVSFLETLESIMDEMKEVDEEFQIEIYRKDSKNYKGKQFITCSVV
jgi:hypothetical protein